MQKFLPNLSFKVGDILTSETATLVLESQEIPKWEFSGLEDFKIIFPLQVQASFQKLSKGTILGNFKINLSFEGKCVRCLEKAQANLEFKTEGIFSIYQNRDEGEFPISKYGEVNIQSLLEQEIITHLPQNFFCKKDCKGLCPVCGVNLNNKKCKCKQVK